jgi:hypothetical protein
MAIKGFGHLLNESIPERLMMGEEVYSRSLLLLLQIDL